MKTVLIIGYPFPLRAGGSPRIYHLAKHLPEFDWQPVILTAPLDSQPAPGLRIIETAYRDRLRFWKRLLGLGDSPDIREEIKGKLGVGGRQALLDFLLTRLGEVVNYPDAEAGWQPYALRAGSELLSGEKVDAIISSSAPVTAHMIAGGLSSKFRVPWVADLRDLWSQNHNYIYSPLRKTLDRRLERKTLVRADALVTVSPPWAEKLSRLHDDKTTWVITNGFSPDELNDPPAPLTEKFTITYTGMVYREWQDISRFLAALQELIADGTINPAETEVRFYGDRSAWLDEEIERYGLSGVAVQYGRIPYRDALARQRESHLLLLLDWEDSSETGVYPGKVFEYLAAGRPILVTGGVAGNVVDCLMAETGAGAHAVTADDIGKALGEMYRQYRAGGSVPYAGEASEINKYSYREMAGRFAGILDTVVREKS